MRIPAPMAILKVFLFYLEHILPEGNTKQLSVREMFNLLMQKKAITVGNDYDAAIGLLNHLNVVKSREYKLFRTLGLDYVNSIFNLNPIMHGSQVAGYEITLVPKPEPKKYAVYQIKDNNPNATNPE